MLVQCNLIASSLEFKLFVYDVSHVDAIGLYRGLYIGFGFSVFFHVVQILDGNKVEDV